MENPKSSPKGGPAKRRNPYTIVEMPHGETRTSFDAKGGDMRKNQESQVIKELREMKSSRKRELEGRLVVEGQKKGFP